MTIGKNPGFQVGRGEFTAWLRLMPNMWLHCELCISVLVPLQDGISPKLPYQVPRGPNGMTQALAWVRNVVNIGWCLLPLPWFHRCGSLLSNWNQHPLLLSVYSPRPKWDEVSFTVPSHSEGSKGLQQPGSIPQAQPNHRIYHMSADDSWPYSSGPKNECFVTGSPYTLAFSEPQEDSRNKWRLFLKAVGQIGFWVLPENEMVMPFFLWLQGVSSTLIQKPFAAWHPRKLGDRVSRPSFISAHGVCPFDPWTDQTKLTNQWLSPFGTDHQTACISPCFHPALSCFQIKPIALRSSLWLTFALVLQRTLSA